MSKVCHCGGGVYGKDQLAGLVWWEAECPNANVMTVCPTAAAFISQGWFWVSGPPVPNPPVTTPAVQGAQAGLNTVPLAAQQTAHAQALAAQSIANSQALPAWAAQQMANVQSWASVSHTPFFDMLEDVPEPATAPERPECQLCGVEMSSYLDAYHGRDAWEAAKCARCRKR